MRGHPRVPVCADMTRESRLVAVLIRDGYIPVPPQCIQHREDLGVAETVDAIFHAQERVSVRYHGCI